MKIISEEIIEIDGFKYNQTTYDNGTVIREIYNENPVPIPEPEDSVNMEEVLLEIQVNTEHLICLNEINED